MEECKHEWDWPTGDDDIMTCANCGQPLRDHLLALEEERSELVAICKAVLRELDAPNSWVFLSSGVRQMLYDAVKNK